MNQIEEKLLFYHSLSRQEQADVDAYVLRHPELQPPYEEIRRLGELFDEARSTLQAPPDDDLLAYYVATRCYSPHGVPVPVKATFERLEAHIASDPAVRSRYEHFLDRLHSLEEESDAKAQFERLAGMSLAGEGGASEADSLRVRSERRSTRRPVGPLIPFPLQWAVAAGVALLLIYGTLYAISYATTPQHERLAAIEHDELQIEGFDVRPRVAATEQEDVSPDLLYVETLTMLRDARSTTLGLFPRYDEEVLLAAEDRLEHVVEQSEPGSFVQLDALYFLGKVQLAQGDISSAQEALQEVVRGEGRMSAEAYDILRQLAADEAY